MTDSGCRPPPAAPGDAPAGVPHGLTPLEAAAAVAAACRDRALTAGAYAVIARTRGQYYLGRVLAQAASTLDSVADALDGAAELDRRRERIRAARLGGAP